jgi:hypothetical protein
MSGTNKSDKERLREEYKLTQRFLGALQRRVEEMQREGFPGDKFQLDDAERALLYQINNLGLKEGAFAGVVALVGLRRIRASFLRRLVQERDRIVGNSQASQSPFPSPPRAPNSPFSTGVNAIPPNSTSKLDGYIQKRSNPFSLGNLFGWALDCTVALSVAASTSLIFTDRKKILNTLSQIPLVPGTSNVSKEFCPALLKELEILRDESLESKDMVSRPQFPPLAAFVEFARNCQLRESFERQYRKANSLSDEEPVVIPPPGLPGAFQEAGFSWSDDGVLNASAPADDVGDPTSLQAIGDDPFQGDDDGGDGTGYFHQQNWADDFTTDQDDKNDRRGGR